MSIRSCVTASQATKGAVAFDADADEADPVAVAALLDQLPRQGWPSQVSPTMVSAKRALDDRLVETSDARTAGRPEIVTGTTQLLFPGIAG